MKTTFLLCLSVISMIVLAGCASDEPVVTSTTTTTEQTTVQHPASAGVTETRTIRSY